jgi:chemotaxis protein histidine kinase CheA
MVYSLIPQFISEYDLGRQFKNMSYDEIKNIIINTPAYRNKLQALRLKRERERMMQQQPAAPVASVAARVEDVSRPAVAEQVVKEATNKANEARQERERKEREEAASKEALSRSTNANRVAAEKEAAEATAARVEAAEKEARAEAARQQAEAARAKAAAQASKADADADAQAAKSARVATTDWNQLFTSVQNQSTLPSEKLSLEKINLILTSFGQKVINAGSKYENKTKLEIQDSVKQKYNALQDYYLSDKDKEYKGYEGIWVAYELTEFKNQSYQIYAGLIILASMLPHDERARVHENLSANLVKLINYDVSEDAKKETDPKSNKFYTLTGVGVKRYILKDLFKNMVDLINAIIGSDSVALNNNIRQKYLKQSNESDPYYSKYLKYKEKYNELKNKLNI